VFAVGKLAQKQYNVLLAVSRLTTTEVEVLPDLTVTSELNELVE
jgi:hypothetical protein